MIEEKKKNKEITQLASDEEGFQVADKNNKKLNSKNRGLNQNQNEKIGQNMKQGKNGNRKVDNKKVHIEYRKKQVQTYTLGTSTTMDAKARDNSVMMHNKARESSKKLTVDTNTMEAIKKCANKNVVLQEMEDGSKENDKFPGKDIVDKIVESKKKPSDIDTSTWTPEMSKYFNERWKQMYDKNKATGGLVEIEDVFENETAAAQFVTADELIG